MNRIKGKYKGKPTASKYKGVQFRKNRPSMWRAVIRFNNKLINISSHKTEKEAALSYNQKAKELFGEYAHLNKVPA